MKIDFSLPPRIETVPPDAPVYGIHLTELTATELDNIRILLQTIFRYGQFKDALTLTKQISLNNVSTAIIKQVNLDKLT